MHYFLDFLSILGAIGLFLFGMKLMSENLQRIAGNKLRSAINFIASSRIKAIFSGLLITAFVQASAVVSVMAVSFVNAGMLSLTESIGIMLGAGIGTTIKIWLISALGFKTEIGIIALPVIGLTLPFLFSKNINRRSWGEFAMGLALLFVGLDFLKYIFDDISTTTNLMEFISGFSGFGFGSVLLFVLAGMIITAIVQSSSATVALTIVMCSNGWISFELAAAMILGENIGTTMTANIAAVVANAQGKRSALSQTIFKVIGVIWALIIFRWFLQQVDLITAGITGISPRNNNTTPFAIAIGLAVFHTLFNVVNAVLIIGFIPYIARLSAWLITTKDNMSDAHNLKYINSQFSSSELVFLEAKNEMSSLARLGRKMFAQIPDLLVEKDETKFEQLFISITAQEEMMDKAEESISGYLYHIYKGKLSDDGLKKVKSMQRIAKELENIGDSVFHMAKSIRRKNMEKAWFTQEQRDNLKKIYDLMYGAFDVLIENLDKDYDSVSLDKAQMLELQINKLRSDLMKEHINKVSSSEHNNKSSVIYIDLISESETLADHIYNINEAISGLK